MDHCLHLPSEQCRRARPQDQYNTLFDEKEHERTHSACPRAKASPYGSNGDDRRQRRKQGGAVGAAASRMQATAKQTLGAATRAVALRSNDGEGKPVSREPPRSDKQALRQSDAIAALMILCQRPCPLRRFAPAPPKGEPLACRATLRWTHKAQQCAKRRASLTGAAASGQAHLVKLL